MSAIQDFVEKIIVFFKRDKQTLDASIIDPPSWRQREVQNKEVDRQYEEALKAKGKEAHWSDRYDKDFENVKKEVVRVRENNL